MLWFLPDILNENTMSSVKEVMNLQVAMQGGDRITKQRNLFLVLTIALSITSGALSLKILAQEERIIMVPPLSSEVMISNRKAGPVGEPPFVSF